MISASHVSFQSLFLWFLLFQERNVCIIYSVAWGKDERSREWWQALSGALFELPRLRKRADIYTRIYYYGFKISYSSWGCIRYGGAWIPVYMCARMNERSPVLPSTPLHKQEEVFFFFLFIQFVVGSNNTSSLLLVLIIRTNGRASHMRKPEVAEQRPGPIRKRFADRLARVVVVSSQVLGLPSSCHSEKVAPRSWFMVLVRQRQIVYLFSFLTMYYIVVSIPCIISS